VCPTKATIFGNREDLIAEAHLRLKENPGKYINKVWGEHEVGGTSVLYISDIDLGFLSYQPNLGTKPLPKTTSVAMESVPFAFAGMGAAMLSLNWIIQRRNKLRAERDKNGEKDEQG
jgi:formate dehydrogenase iron-sulfur subunit